MNIRRSLAVGLLLIPLAFVTVSCGGITRPSGWASPAFEDSTAFVFESKDHLVSLALQDTSARIQWSFPDKQKEDQKDISLQAVYGQPVLEDGSLFIGSYRGELFALDPATGDLRLTHDSGGHIAGGLAPEGGQFAFATTEGRLFLVNQSDFSPASGWPADGKGFGEGIWSTPVLTADRIFVSTMKGHVIALDRATGEEVWSFKASGALPSLSLLDDGHLFAAGLGKKVYVLDTASGDKLAELSTDDWVWTTPAFEDGVAYFGDFSGNVYALDITNASGEAKWVFRGGSKVKAGPVVINDTVVVADREPVVYFLKAADGTAANTVPLPGAKAVNANLVVHDGAAVMVTTSGRLFRADPGTLRVEEITFGGAQ